MTGKRERGEESEPEDATVAAPRGVTRADKEEADGNITLSTFFLVLQHRASTKSPRRRIAVVLLPSAEKDAKGDAPAGESRASTFTTQRAFPGVLGGPAKLTPHVLPGAPLVRPMVQGRWTRP